MRNKFWRFGKRSPRKKAVRDGPQIPAGLTAFYTLSVDEVCDLLETSPELGLTDPNELDTRRQLYGPNELKAGEKVKLYQIVFRHLFNFMSFVLFAALVLALSTTQWIDSGVVAAIIVINTIIGVSQGKNKIRVLFFQPIHC